MSETTQMAVRKVLAINQTWITRGHLSDDTARYLRHLAAQRPLDLQEVCELALEAARKASREQRDPKPGFYASIFSRSTKEERNEYLRDHFFTRLLSAEIQAGGADAVL